MRCLPMIAIAAACGGISPASPPPPPASLQWFSTCGDPACSGHRDAGVVACTQQEEAGVSCPTASAQCDPGNLCNSYLLCAASDPKLSGCPVSRIRFKKDIRYPLRGGAVRLPRPAPLAAARHLSVSGRGGRLAPASRLHDRRPRVDGLRGRRHRGPLRLRQHGGGRAAIAGGGDRPAAQGAPAAAQGAEAALTALTPAETSPAAGAPARATPQPPGTPPDRAPPPAPSACTRRARGPRPSTPDPRTSRARSGAGPAP